MIALSSGLTRSARSIAASTSSAGDASPLRTSSACAVASISVSSCSLIALLSPPGGISTAGSPARRRSARASRRPRRTARTTPGMKLWRSIESWRIESVWPSPPKITSWWATRPGSRTEWIGSCTLPPASPISSAVRLAVPEGASILLVVVQLDDLALGHVRGDQLRRLHHQHRADREVRAPRSTSPRRRPPPPRARSSSRSNPVAPTTACTPASTAVARVLEHGLGRAELDHHVGALEAPRPEARPARGRPWRRAPSRRRPRRPRRRSPPCARRRRRRPRESDQP